MARHQARPCVAVRCRPCQFGKDLLGFTLSLFGKVPGLLDCNSHDTLGWKVCLEVVVLCIKCQQEAVGKGEHAVDDGENDASHSTINGGEVGYVGSTGKVQFQEWWVDESDLSGANEWNDVGQGTQKDTEATAELDVFDTLLELLALAIECTASATYKFGYHVGIQLDVALTIPVYIHVELDAFCFSLGD